MHPITTKADLLDLPSHERQTVIVVDDVTAQGVVEHASRRPGEAAEIDEPAWLQPLAIRVAADSGIRRAAVGRARELAANAARASSSSSRVGPALVIGAMGVAATAAVFIIGRDGVPDNVVVISASAAEELTFDDEPFRLERLYSAHPKQNGRYLRWSPFSRAILNERTLEAEEFLITCCGASQVETIVEHGDELTTFAGISAIPGIGSGKWGAKLVKSTKDRRVIKAPGWSTPSHFEPSDWTWFDGEPVLGAIYRERLAGNITYVERFTEMKDERSVDLKVPKVLGQKLNLNAEVKRHDKTVVTWKVSFPAA